jgi:hypothetical protein
MKAWYFSLGFWKCILHDDTGCVSAGAALPAHCHGFAIGRSQGKQIHPGRRKSKRLPRPPYTESRCVLIVRFVRQTVLLPSGYGGPTAAGLARVILPGSGN